MPSDIQLVVRNDFSDLEQFGQFVEAWNLFFLQLEKGVVDVRFAQLMRPRLLIGYCKMSQKVDQRGESPAGYWTFAFASAPRIVWRNIEVGTDEVIIYSPGSEIKCVSWPGFEVVTVSIQESLLVEVLNRLDGGEATEIMRDQVLVTTNPALVRRLRLRLIETLKVITQPQCNDVAMALTAEEEVDIIEEIYLAVRPVIRNNNVVSAPQRLNAIKQVRELYDQPTNTNLTVSELCHTLGVSERTLQYAFKEHLGISPKRFINNTRLRHVHKSLLQSSIDNTTVSAQAGHWGFWHMGQFTRDYKRMFGCTPSETLQRNA